MAYSKIDFEKIKEQIKTFNAMVNTTTKLFVDESFTDPRFMKCRIAVMHDGKNVNSSRFTLKVIKAATETFKNIPILADVQTYTDAEGKKYLDYSGHSMHVEQDAFNEDEERVIYDETVVGIIPESNNFEIVEDEKTGKNYVYVDCLLFREYGNYVCDILESRGGVTDVSAEINCGDCSYSAKDKCLDVGVMQMCAVTLLGAHVRPGMEGAHAEAFSYSNPKTEQEQETINNQLLQIMQEIKESLDNYINLEKGGNKKVENEKLELEQETSEKEVEETNEEFSEDSTPDVTEENSEKELNESNESQENTSEENNETDITVENEAKEPELEVQEQKILESKVECSFVIGEHKTEFSVSLSDIIFALTELVNETYSDEYNYYFVDVFDADKYVIMRDYYGKAYKQSYKVKKDSYTLTGDRIPVKAVYLTEDEEKALDSMRSKYSEMEVTIKEYEADENMRKLNALFSSEEYLMISELDEFKTLKESHEKGDKLVYEEVLDKADKLLLDAVKSGKIQYNSSTPEHKKSANKIGLPVNGNAKKKKSRYGNLFDGIL